MLICILLGSTIMLTGGGVAVPLGNITRAQVTPGGPEHPVLTHSLLLVRVRDDLHRFRLPDTLREASIFEVLQWCGEQANAGTR